MSAPAVSSGGQQKRIRLNSGSIPVAALLSTATTHNLSWTVTA